MFKRVVAALHFWVTLIPLNKNKFDLECHRGEEKITSNNKIPFNKKFLKLNAWREILRIFWLYL